MVSHFVEKRHTAEDLHCSVIYTYIPYPYSQNDVECYAKRQLGFINYKVIFLIV